MQRFKFQRGHGFSIAATIRFMAIILIETGHVPNCSSASTVP